MKRLPWYIAAGAMLLATLLTGCRGGGRPAEGAPSTGTPPANGWRQPRAELVVNNIEEPVSLVFLSATTAVVAERRSGRIRWLENGQLRPEPFATLQVANPPGYHEYGLLGLAADLRDAQTPYVYAFYTVPDASGRAAGQRIVRFRVQDGKGVDQTTIVDGLPAGVSCCHNGGRLLFSADGHLFATVGDTQREELAQNNTALAGKVLRYNADGTIPDDNPYDQTTLRVNTSDELDAVDPPLLHTPVYTLGHRNPFGIAQHPDTGEIYVTENGPDHDDEINRLVAGDNYGWPTVMGSSTNPRFHEPAWASGNKIIAPTGATFYTGTALPQLRGTLVFANYGDGHLRRATFDGIDHVSRIDIIDAAGTDAKLDAAMGLDGQLYYTSMTAIYRLRG